MVLCDGWCVVVGGVIDLSKEVELKQIAIASILVMSVSASFSGAGIDRVWADTCLYIMC